jgi:hypothetical protein
VELPRPTVADYLEGIDPQICARYLEYLIQERHEETPIFHDRLAELYLSMTLAARKRGDERDYFLRHLVIGFVDFSFRITKIRLLQAAPLHRHHKALQD